MPKQKHGGSFAEPVMYAATTASGVIVLLMLAALVVTLFTAANPSIRRFGTDFLISTSWQPNSLPVLKVDANGNHIPDPLTGMKVVDHYKPPQFGALPAISGTAQTSAIALVIAIPLSLGAALYLVRIAPAWMITPMSFLIEFLAAIPSIAYGLWGMFVLGPWMGGPARTITLFGFLPFPAGIERRIVSVLIHVPGLRWLVEQRIDGKTVIVPTTGRDILVAGMILGIMIIPIITAISRDVLKNIPRAQIEGTIALGATWWQSCQEMLRFGRSGLFGAVILGLARAAGETMAVLMVMGSTVAMTSSPFASGATMASTLAGEFPEAATNDLHRGALMELALILLLLSLAFNVTARYLVVGKSRTLAAH
jgi:phosphate transport system permease protein